jgi:HSP20 family protein
MALPTRVARNQGVDPMESVQREFDSMLNRWWGGREMTGSNQGFAPYAVDVREDADHIYVDAELPGFKKEDVDITLENQTLTISAERKSETRKTGNGGSAGAQDGGDLLLHERRYNRFLRSFTLPPTVNEQNVTASLQDGVLTIVLTKREETKPRKVQVS